MRLCLIAVAIGVSACSGSNSPTAPSAPPVPVHQDVTGSYTGTYTIIRCNDNTGFALCGGLAGGGFSLTIVDASGRLTGSMQYGSISSSVTGSSNATGSITIDPWTANLPLSGRIAVFRTSTIQFQATSGSLTGGFHINSNVTGLSGALDADTSLTSVFRR